ncbi:MAG: heme ABC transporter permease CcmC [Gammaproteobacteria bacterium]|nr:MAG: heme ABC transporter permease CcmC [Gammaproteobacteria bacterium]
MVWEQEWLIKMLNAIWRWIQKFSSPKYFYNISGRMTPWFGWSCLLLILVGVYAGLVLAPVDYQQGNSYRIIFIHVPSAWMSLFIYIVMAISGAIGLIWRIKLAHVISSSSALIGASFTFLALITGSLWGKPTWGTWWVWDARLTSELILLFLYLGFIALRSAIEDKSSADRATAVLALVGAVNIPIIHYSVTWWNTLHQGTTVARLDGPAIHSSMLIPLLLMALAFKLFYVTIVLMRARSEVLDRERNSSWVQEVIRSS